MAVGEEENRKGEGKGFAGLSSLVSNVEDTTAGPLSKPTGTGPEHGAKPKVTSPLLSPHRRPRPPISPSFGGKWVLGLVVGGIGALWLVGQSAKQSSPSTPANVLSRQAPSYAKPSTPASPPERHAPARPGEVMPPVGRDHVLSSPQIRYCVAEDIRLGGAKSAVNSYSDSDVNEFNSMVAAYNSRCTSFRYRQGALESARRDMEPYRMQLQVEGRSRLMRSSLSISNTPTPQQSAPIAALEQASPEHLLLDALRIMPGTSERKLESGKAIIAYAHAGYVNLKPDLRVDYSDYRRFKKPAYFLGHEIVVIDEEYFAGYIGCCVSPGIAITVKVNGSLEELQIFAESNSCGLTKDTDAYFGSQLLPTAPAGTYATLSCKERDAL